LVGLVDVEALDRAREGRARLLGEEHPGGINHWTVFVICLNCIEGDEEIRAKFQ
jgi:hypothetical protein